MGYYETFHHDEPRTTSAKLAQLLHHYDEVDPVIRVMDYDPGRQGFPLSMVPPPSDEDVETVKSYLSENGYTAEYDGVILTVTSMNKEIA